MSLVQAEALVQTADVQLAVNLHVREEVRWLFKCAVLPASLGLAFWRVERQYACV